jgi:hypothetical protein
VFAQVADGQNRLPFFYTHARQPRSAQLSKNGVLFSRPPEVVRPAGDETGAALLSPFSSQAEMAEAGSARQTVIVGKGTKAEWCVVSGDSSAMAQEAQISKPSEAVTSEAERSVASTWFGMTVLRATGYLAGPQRDLIMDEARPRLAALPLVPEAPPAPGGRDEPAEVVQLTNLPGYSRTRHGCIYYVESMP